MAGPGHPRGKAVAVEEYMPALGEAIIRIVIAIIETGGMRHTVDEPDLGRRKVVIGAKMW